MEWTIFIAVCVWCDNVRDIRLWPSGFYNTNYTKHFINALSYYDDGECIKITKDQLENSSLIFSFKLRYPQSEPQIRILAEDEHTVCKGRICYNETSAIVMVYSPASVEPDERNLFYPGSRVCPYVRAAPWSKESITRCHFWCPCDQWVEDGGFCDSQFVVVVSHTVIPYAGNEVKFCGIRERTPWLT